jgi:dolichol-phosphate mannosyltransferase
MHMVKPVCQIVRLGIVIPTYNESENIKKLINGIKKCVVKAGMPCTVLIVDDNSPDGTGDIAEKLSRKYRITAFTVQVLHHSKKVGIHVAYIDGFTKLQKGNYTHIMQMDGDLSHDPNYIPNFIHAAQSADFIVGSRYVPGGTTPDWSIYRKTLSRYGNLYARLLLGHSIHDYTGGYNLFSSHLLRKIKPSSISATGYGFQIELKMKALNISKEFIEVPIIFRERQKGFSKIPRYVIPGNLLLISKIALHNLLS